MEPVSDGGFFEEYGFFLSVCIWHQNLTCAVFYMTIINQQRINASKLLSGTQLHGAELVAVEEHNDNRGSFAEIFQAKWALCVDPVQWSIVKSDENVLRGMHLHQRHDEIFTLISGHCLVGLKDVRSDSPTLGQYSLYELHEDDLRVLVFPRGIIHGWYFYTRSIHIQGVSESYVDYNHDDNYGCQWNAEDLGIPWPITAPILSERTKSFTTQEGLLDKLERIKSGE